ncbi:ATP-binding protein [Anaeromyxobacter oryzae]|uniref:ATPase n=1 Tax=Anaeromyxobacter oryzae TaxID=2918170 RepID=A0ABN6MZU3_9BACT|nr:ATP-binding protein [Anaeromyxobacter oryzae]BDG06482.1 ATPase [Anaeromyxobacter oryzae]
MSLDPELTAQLKRVLSSLEPLLPKPVQKIDWATCHAANWHRSTYSGTMEPVPSIEAMHLDDLLGIESQKRIVEENTRQFLEGLPANNALLWGTRGTGKSSLVRALLHAYAAKGLRIVQVDKDDLVSLPAIVDELKAQPFRFIVFSDDLSFETGDASYKVLKSALDGSVYALPDNVLIYVTSNRRHLVPEYESDNRGAMLVNGEVHHGEAVEEKISLSGRFGLWVGFHPFSQDLYVDVVRRWVDKLGRKVGGAVEWTRDAETEAILWSQRKGDRSGRIAYQFACDFVGRALMSRERR